MSGAAVKSRSRWARISSGPRAARPKAGSSQSPSSVKRVRSRSGSPALKAASHSSRSGKGRPARRQGSPPGQRWRVVRQRSGRGRERTTGRRDDRGAWWPPMTDITGEEIALLYTCWLRCQHLAGGKFPWQATNSHYPQLGGFHRFWRRCHALTAGEALAIVRHLPDDCGKEPRRCLTCSILWSSRPRCERSGDRPRPGGANGTMWSRPRRAGNSIVGSWWSSPASNRAIRCSTWPAAMGSQA